MTRIAQPHSSLSTDRRVEIYFHVIFSLYVLLRSASLVSRCAPRVVIKNKKQNSSLVSCPSSDVVIKLTSASGCQVHVSYCESPTRKSTILPIIARLSTFTNCSGISNWGRPLDDSVLHRSMKETWSFCISLTDFKRFYQGGSNGPKSKTAFTCTR